MPELATHRLWGDRSVYSSLPKLQPCHKLPIQNQRPARRLGTRAIRGGTPDFLAPCRGIVQNAWPTLRLPGSQDKCQTSTTSLSHDGVPCKVPARLVVRRSATLRRQAWFAMKDAAVTSGVGSPRTLRLQRLTLHSQCICGKLFLEAMQRP